MKGYRWEERWGVRLLGDDGRRIVKQVFRCSSDGLLLAEFELFVLGSELLDRAIDMEDYSGLGNGSMCKMINTLFWEDDRLKVLEVLSRWCGKLKCVKWVYWVEGICFPELAELPGEGKDLRGLMIWMFVAHIENRLLKKRGLLIFGSQREIPELFSVLDEMRFRCLDGLEYRIGCKANREWNLRLEILRKSGAG